jgi:hypothetical protein
VLAVTQLSLLLLTHLSWASLGHTVFLLLVADRLKGESDSEHEQARDRRGAERGRTVASGVKAARSGGCTRSGSGQ